jgi:hypothetical protein
MTEQSADPPAWVRAFFGGENRLRFEDINANTAPDEWASEIRSWLGILDRDDDAGALLPQIDAGGRVSWYAVAQSIRGALRLAEDLGGFIGETYGAFDGRPHEPQPHEAGGLILAVTFPSPLYLIAPQNAADAARIRRSLNIYRKLVERRPISTRLAARSVGALRTRFDRALLAGNDAEAERLCDEILATGRLSWDNRLYLRVRLRAGLGQWSYIAGDAALLREAQDLQLPPQVRAEILEALYRTHIDPVEDPHDPNAALTEFQTKVMGRYGRLFTTRQGLTQTRVVKAFLLSALLRPQPAPAELEELASLLSNAPEEAPFSIALRQVVDQRIRELAIPPPDTSGPASADAAFDDFDYDLALSLYAALPPSRRSIGRMLQCAQTIGRADAAETALAALDAVSGVEANLPEYLRATVSALRALIAPPALVKAQSGERPASAFAVPDNWLDWARWVAEGAHPAEARRILEERCAGWPISSYHLPAEADELARCLGNACVSASGVMQAAFTHLFEAFVSNSEKAEPAWKPIYTTLLTALAMAGSRSADDLELARQLASLLLEAGLSPNDYQHLVGDLMDLLGQEASLATLDWALDLAEVVAVNRTASPPTQLNFIVAVLEVARARIHRLTRRHVEALRTLCADLNISADPYLSGAPEEDEEANAVAALAGRSIAIYTLAETAGLRALRMLNQLIPTADIALNSDKVCTERLAALARSADLFVFAWRSSKHAAYYCIKDHRPRDLPILMPQGKGTASIVRALIGN